MTKQNEAFSIKMKEFGIDFFKDSRFASVIADESKLQKNSQIVQNIVKKQKQLKTSKN